MKLSRYRTMDLGILPGLVNTALRNDCADLGDLVRTHDLDRTDFEARMAEIGYRYVAESNQFRPLSGADGE